MSPIFFIILIAGLSILLVGAILRQYQHGKKKKNLSKSLYSGEHDTAIQNMLHLVKNDPDDLFLLRDLARLQLKAGQSTEALKTARSLLEKNLQGSGISQVDAILLVADAEEATGQTDKAYKNLLTAKGLDSSNPEVNLKLCSYEYQRGNFQESFSYSGLILRLNPSERQGMLYRGLSAFRMGNMETAMEALTKTLQLDATNFEAADALCQIYSQYGNTQEAASYGDLARRLAKTGEQRARILHTLATGYLASGNTAKAKEKLEEAFKETSDDEMRKKILLLLLGIEEEKKEIATILKIIRQYLNLDPHNALIKEKHEYYREIFSNQGLQKYEMLPLSQFSDFCRELSKTIANLDHIQHSEINRDGSVDILASKTTKREHVIYQFRFLRSTTPIGEMFVRDLYAKMRANSGEKAYIISNSDYTDGAKAFSETRVITLIGKEQLAPILLKTDKK